LCSAEDRRTKTDVGVPLIWNRGPNTHPLYALGTRTFSLHQARMNNNNIH
jgi:hypothetical protein